MNRLTLTLVALVAAGVLLFVAVLPPAPQRLDPSAWGGLASRTVAGAYHVHTTRSDGSADKPAVAAAAARAGLKFVIVTDHGDATRPPDPPVYIDGVLCLDAVEISTDQGHYVALDMPRAPYPLGGAADAVAEDVARLGGFGIAAHPDSPKRALQWTDAAVPIDGIEWLNADSEWRSESRATLVRAGLAYVVRPAPALASLLDRPATLDRWDRMTSARRVVALGGADAHGGIGRRSEDGGRSGVLGVPGYEASFRTFSNRVVLGRAPTGDAAVDARAVYEAIRRGHVFTTIDALAAPGLLDFRAEIRLNPDATGVGSAFRRAEMGESAAGGEPVMIVARALMPPNAQLVLYRAGQEVARTDGDLRWDAGAIAGAYRVEVHLPSAPGQPPVPWLVSNPIYVGTNFQLPTPNSQVARSPKPKAQSQMSFWQWRIEKDAASSAIVRASGKELSLEYELGTGERRGQFVALASDLHEESFSGIDQSLAADKPTRVSIQVRRADGKRWGRSVYVDPSGAAVHLSLASMRPLDEPSERHPDATAITSVLLVVDLTNASPGRSGTLHVRGSALVK